VAEDQWYYVAADHSQVPVTWAQLQQSSTVRALGLIGGFGLIALPVMWVIGLQIAAFMR